MKVIVAHNRYQSSMPSGENRVVDSEIALLREGGVEVVPFIEYSDRLFEPSLTLLEAAVGPVISPRAIRRLRALITQTAPDVLHVHNVFPLISPWAIRTATSMGVPVVHTVHNYRHSCVAGTHYKNGAICQRCPNSAVPWPAVTNACYRGSRVQSAVMAVGQTAHGPTWRRVSRFLVTSPHMTEGLVRQGVPINRIEWRPTYAADPGVSPPPTHGGLVFIGRLEQEKGVELLLNAWTPAVARRWTRLVIAGRGRLADVVEAKSADDPTIQSMGLLTASEVQSAIRASTLVALPSLWFEGFPHVVTEALAIGRPIIVSARTGVCELAARGVGWSAADTPEAWVETLLQLDDTAIRAAATRARRLYESLCSPDVALDQLRRVYSDVAAAPVP